MVDKKYKYERVDHLLFYDDNFIPSELVPVQDIYVGRLIIKCVSTKFSDPQVIASKENKILDGHHAWGGAILAGANLINGFKFDCNFEEARNILNKESKLLGRAPEIDNSKDILLHEFNVYKDLRFILDDVIPEEYSKSVYSFIDKIGVKEFLGRLDYIKSLTPVVGYLKERMPTFIRRLGDYDYLADRLNHAKLKDINVKLKKSSDDPFSLGGDSGEDPLSGLGSEEGGSKEDDPLGGIEL